MKNSEILNAGKCYLNYADRNRQFIMVVRSRKCPCPNCGTKQSLYEAARIADIDSIDVELEPGDGPYRCIGCDCRIKLTAPDFVGEWIWTLAPYIDPALVAKAAMGRRPLG
jgi:hypothetical protein